MRPLRRAIAVALAFAAAGFAGTVWMAADDPRRALIAWICAYAFAFASTVGALVLVMILDVTGATWSLVLRPILTAISGACPILIILFVPILVGLRLVYPWARLDPSLEEDVRATLAHQRAWNNPAFFALRSAVYLGAWSLLAVRARKKRTLAGPGLVVVAFTLTFASYDWVMALEAGWVSTIFGIYVFAGGLVAAISLTSVFAWLARRWGLLPDAVGAAHFGALGRLLLMAVLFWAYVAFFQFLLIWIADLPREVGFFARRAEGPFAVVGAILVVGHFALPLLLLLSRSLKRAGWAVAAIGAWLTVMAALDSAWLVLPASAATLGPIDVAALFAVGGVVFAYGGWNFLARQPLDDTQIAASLRYEAP